MTSGAAACICFFFFQAEDGIRDVAVTGVQTCALPICESYRGDLGEALGGQYGALPADVVLIQREDPVQPQVGLTAVAVPRARAQVDPVQIGRASCRERV